MKKHLLLLAAGCVILAGALVMVIHKSDRQPPEILFPKTQEYYGGGTEEMLEGVEAKDESDGDVSDSIRIDSVYEEENGEELTIIYTAKDTSNNVVKKSRKMIIGDPSNKKEDEEDKEDKDDKEENEGLKADQEKFSRGLQDKAEDQPEAQPTDTPDQELPDVTGTPGDENNSEEKEEEREAKDARREQEAAAAAMPEGAPRFYLTEYYIKVPVGTQLDELSYVDRIEDDDDEYELWRKIQVNGTVDTNIPGTYTLTYLVVDSQSNPSNQAVLTVVVE